MFSFWVQNEVTGESTCFRGQGTTLPKAFEDGWSNAGDDFRKSSSGDFTTRAHLAVRLPGGETVFRTPERFVNTKPYDRAKEYAEFAQPIATGAAALPAPPPQRL